MFFNSDKKTTDTRKERQKGNTLEKSPGFFKLHMAQEPRVSSLWCFRMHRRVLVELVFAAKCSVAIRLGAFVLIGVDVLILNVAFKSECTHERS
jgi:hypothetical protein